MDREFLKKLSRQIPDSSMDQRCDKICQEKKSKGLDRQPLVEDLLRSCQVLEKAIYQREECNQASYSIKDPNNMLSSQKHLLTKKCKAFMIQNTHTHTHTTSLTNFIFQKQVKTVQGAYINTCISCDGRITFYWHMYQKQQTVCVLYVKTLQECISVLSYDNLRNKEINFISHTIITTSWGLSPSRYIL